MNRNEPDWDFIEDCMRRGSWEQLSPEETAQLEPWYSPDSFNRERALTLLARRGFADDFQDVPPLPDLLEPPQAGSAGAGKRFNFQRWVPVLGLAASMAIAIWWLMPSNEHLPIAMNKHPEDSVFTKAPKSAEEIAFSQNYPEVRQSAQSPTLEEHSSPSGSAATAPQMLFDLQQESEAGQAETTRTPEWNLGSDDAMHPPAEKYAYQVAEHAAAPPPAAELNQRKRETAPAATNTGANALERHSPPSETSAIASEVVYTEFPVPPHWTVRDSIWKNDSLFVQYIRPSKSDTLIFSGKIRNVKK